MGKIHQALELFDAQGQRRTRTQAEAEIQSAIQTLERWEDKNLQPIIPQSQNPKLLTFLSWTEARRGRLGLPTEVLQALCFLWFFQHREKVSKYLAAKYIQTLCWLQAQALPRPWMQLYPAVDQILRLVVRASSLVESMNSILRLYQQNKKHVSEEFLYLCAVYFGFYIRDRVISFIGIRAALAGAQIDFKRANPSYQLVRSHEIRPKLSQH